MPLNGNYEQLVNQITDLVLSKLDEQDFCPTFCRADVERIVDAGAERTPFISSSLLMRAPADRV